MPELPEVHTITSDLKKHVTNAVIKSVKVARGYKTIPESKIFVKLLTGKEITKIDRVAKNIMFELNSDIFLIMHLGMTGQILFKKKGAKQDKWMRVVLLLEKEGKKGELRYCDMRMFGKVKIFNNKDINEFLNKYGPDPLKDKLDPKKFLEIIRSKRTNIKNALLDQSLIAGVGNIYANEALWTAKIHPEAKTTNIPLPTAKDLLQALKEILKESISNRGATLSDKMYVDIFGKSGKHQEHLRIYGKETCSRCNIPVRFKKINGRGTYYCDNCQEKNGQTKLL